MKINELKEASYYKKLKSKVVQCQLCPHYCTIKNGERGKCRVRENQDGKLYSLVYGKPCSVNLDPIEKKPFYHFMPGQQALSIATTGCNLQCKHCQNWEISQAKPEDIPSTALSPQQVIEQAKKSGVKIISYTYTEPTIFYEYMLDIARLARKQSIKNTIVSNGFINPEPLKELCRHIDAANIDLKSISDEFYKKVCNARVEPVLESLKILKQKKVWLEITNLIIPGLNDNKKDIKNLIDWISDNLGEEVPLHFSAFYPCYRLMNLPCTPAEILEKARNLALNSGLKYVYTGNVNDIEGSTTYCPNQKCRKPLIKRKAYFKIAENNTAKGECRFCKTKIAGIWE